MRDEESIFAEALRHSDPADRAAFLDRACEGDADLRRGVDALLGAHDQSHGVLEFPPPGLDSTAPASDSRRPAEPLGIVIGPYKLLERLGEGGMGAVYMAEQQSPVRRMVALKIVKPGMDSSHVIARFEAERQALAMMDHPNIARVFDAGTTEAGRPYFVMELVKGVPLTDYCDQNRLTPRKRLELFIQVCQAVQHAHQKGIIHRDLKPTNVLVTLHDGTPVPKIIDFGIAKATNGDRLTERTLFTNYNQLVGTPLYMSPEQAELSGLDVDTRSDVYSLGVLLYELLTGTTPFDRERLKKAAYDEIRRIIREEEPPRPSTRLSTLGDTLTAVSGSRATEPKKLGQLVRGELDWIVMKCLEKDRTRRYETASAVGRDLERYLADEPVSACPPSARYRVGKIVRRHKAAVAVSGAFAVVLIAATAVSTRWALRARAEQRSARTAADITQAVNDFLNKDLLGMANPVSQPDRDIKLRTVLDRASATIDGQFKDKPLVEAAVRHTLGTTYYALGEIRSAEAHLRRAADLRTAALGEGHPDTLATLRALASVWAMQGNRGLEVLRLRLRILDANRRTRGEEDRETLASLIDLAECYVNGDGSANAEPLYAKALAIQRRVLGEEHPDTLKTYLRLATFRPDEAEGLYRNVIDTQLRGRRADDPLTLTAQFNLALLLGNRGDFDQAIPLYRQLLESQRRVLGDKHHWLGWAMACFSGVLERAGGGPPGKYDEEVERLRRQALAIERDAWGDGNWYTWNCTGALAQFLRTRHRYEEAEAVYRDGYTRMRALKHAMFESTEDLAQGLDGLYREWDRPERAAEWQREHSDILHTFTQALEKELETAPDDPDTLHRLAEAYAVAGSAARQAGSAADYHELASKARERFRQWGRLLQRLNEKVPTSGSLGVPLPRFVAEMDEPPAPFGAAPAPIPGVIQAEEYDRGGLFVGYYDCSLELSSRQRGSMVELNDAKDDGGGLIVGHTQAGEWLAYTVDVAEDGEYDFELRVACGLPDAQLHVEFDDNDATGPLTAPNTGDWQNWQTVAKPGVKLKAGRQLMRIVFDRNVTGGVTACDLNWIRISKSR